MIIPPPLVEPVVQNITESVNMVYVSGMPTPPPPPPPPPTKPAAIDANGDPLQLEIPYKMKHRFDASRYQAVRLANLLVTKSALQYGPSFITIEAGEMVKVCDVYDKDGWIQVKKPSGESGNVPPNYIEKAPIVNLLS